MMTVILLLWALPITFITGFALGVHEVKSTAEPLPDNVVFPPKQQKRVSLITIDGEFIRHN